MNKYILFLIAICVTLSTSVIAQNYTVTPIPASGSADLDDPMTNPDDVVAYAKITNNTSDTLFLRWERIMNDKPDSWETAVCDKNLCYFPWVATKDFFLAPNEADQDLLVHASPAMEPGGIPMYGADPGDAIVHLKVSNLNDPADTLIAIYNFSVTGSPIADLTEVELAALKLYPNPASDFFKITETQEIKELAVYNILGRQVESFVVNGGNQEFDISNLPNGMYLVGMMDRDQETVKTVRLQKH